MALQPGYDVPKCCVVTGGSGFVGQQLDEIFDERGFMTSCVVGCFGTLAWLGAGLLSCFGLTGPFKGLTVQFALLGGRAEEISFDFR